MKMQQIDIRLNIPNWLANIICDLLANLGGSLQNRGIDVRTFTWERSEVIWDE